MDTLNEVRHALPAAAAETTKGSEEDPASNSTTSNTITAAADEILAASTATPRPLPQAQPAREADPQSLPFFMARSFTIHDIPTDVWVQLFADRTVLACSQAGNGRIGNWLLCKRTVVDSSMLTQKAADTHVSHLLGATQRDDPLLQVYAQQVTEQIAQATTGSEEDSSTVLLLGLSLDPLTSKDPAVFRTLIQLLGNVYRDAITMAARRGA